MTDLYLKIEVTKISYDEVRLYGKTVHLQCISAKKGAQSHFQSICQDLPSESERLNSDSSPQLSIMS